jgi:hypothetical protein
LLYEASGRLKHDLNSSEPNSAESCETNKVCGSAGKKKCSICGQEFHCGAAVRATGRADFSCWCEELPQVSAIEPERDCFCPECLRAALNTIGGP